MDICRFAGLNDTKYNKVAAAVRRIALRPPGKAQRLDDNKKRALLDSLKFDQIDARQMSIKAAHATTCQWLLKQSEYLDWLNPVKLPDHHGFLWIKGKPGTGKSTLMKFALANFRSYTKNRTIIIAFFFNARGADLERSTVGMYRSLLLQLLTTLPRLQNIFESLGYANWNSSSDHIWSIEPLKALFEKSILKLGRNAVACFIDALDECEEDQIRDMVVFFQHIGDLAMLKGIQFQVFFSSRHYPHIAISQGLSLILEGQEGHNQDMADYINSTLRIGPSTRVEKIKSTLQKKSSGVFIWVVLVVGMLTRSMTRAVHPAVSRRNLTRSPETSTSCSEIFSHETVTTETNSSFVSNGSSFPANHLGPKSYTLPFSPAPNPRMFRPGIKMRCRRAPLRGPFSIHQRD